MELARVRERGARLPRRIQVGAMLEVPALIYQLPELLGLVDFISIGTNDLFQFMFASDRANYQMSERYDSLSPVALGTLRLILQQCQAARVPVSICGEMAARPLDVMALLGIGFRTISMSPPAVGPIKATIRGVRLAALESFVDSICSGRQRSVREQLRAYAIDHGVML
jgi:phosphotransferase system enzyme I (PtsP)